jgi:hypothetical protein
MNFKSISRKFGMYLFYTLAAISSLALSFGIIAFLFNLDDKGLLQIILILLLITVIFWLITFGLSIIGEQDKALRKKQFINLIHKIPLIILSTFITGIYIMIMFFFLSFMTVSKYGGGGMAGDSDKVILMGVLVVMGVIIISLVMYKVMNTEKQDIALTIYNQFSILKWTSLIVLPFGVWASYYFYHTEGDVAWIAMGVWSLIFYGFYRLFNRIAEKVQNHIIDANLNRIIHEKRKKVLHQQKEGKTEITEVVTSVNISPSISDELQKLKNLLDTNVLTEEEFKVQKERLLK